jgi:hypothetical protein
VHAVHLGDLEYLDQPFRLKALDRIDVRPNLHPSTGPIERPLQEPQHVLVQPDRPAMVGDGAHVGVAPYSTASRFDVLLHSAISQ